MAVREGVWERNGMCVCVFDRWVEREREGAYVCVCMCVCVCVIKTYIGMYKIRQSNYTALNCYFSFKFNWTLILDCVFVLFPVLKWFSSSQEWGWFHLIRTIDITLNRLINGTYHLPCFALIVLLVAASKINLKERALVSGTKQRH